MLIVITSEISIENEAQKINQLFEAGLECLHFRKPSLTIEQYRFLLNQIDKQSHNRIVVHHFHELINEFNLKGIHFPEQKRIDHIDNPGRYFLNLEMYGKTISSSFHKPETLANCEFEFDYHFLSPVFSSISKEGYEGKGFDVNHIDKRIIALGGINETNIPETYQLGFNGVAVLGSVWKSENVLKSFERLKDTIQ
ncbi:thiamine phosphate synthase [Aquimarina agarilytica]|uniref:thiamine phosphate synthase n=1 Tax=Aquimarina agarilytica TaxID=1087449 RepID=UPI00028999AE|nr:thiamine phosphate synthase [Aquimarina agarilytica]